MPRAHSCPARPIFRAWLLRIRRIGRLRVDAEHPLHRTRDTSHDPSYRPSDHAANGAGGLVADCRSARDPAGDSLGLGGATQRKRHQKGKRYHGVKFHVVWFLSRRSEAATCSYEYGGLEAFLGPPGAALWHGNCVFPVVADAVSLMAGACEGVR